MWMLLCGVLGVGNFAMHRAVIESGHPFVEDSKLHFGKHFGKYSSYVIEFTILTGSMLFAAADYGMAAAAYVTYSAFNALAAWLLLSGRI